MKSVSEDKTRKEKKRKDAQQDQIKRVVIILSL